MEANNNTNNSYYVTYDDGTEQINRGAGEGVGKKWCVKGLLRLK